MRAPLVLPLVCFIAGIGLADPGGSNPAAAGASAAFLFCVAFLPKRILRRPVRRAAFLAAFAAAGTAFTVRQMNSAVPTLPGPPGTQVLLTGCVAEPPLPGAANPFIILESASGARLRVSLSGQSASAADRLAYGAVAKLPVKLREPGSFRNPGAFDYTDWMARREIHGAASLLPQPSIQILGGGCGNRVLGALYAVRLGMLRRIDSLWGRDEYQRAMMRGLLLGDASQIRRVWVEDFRRTGTYHALVISGSHITLVCGILLLWVRSFGYGQRTVLAFAAVSAWLYAFIAGAEAPVLRAAAGFALYACARLLNRRASLLNLTAAVAIAFLAWDPRQLLDASFQLSFLAVAALGVLADHEFAASGSLSTRLRREARLVSLSLAAESLEFGLRIPSLAAAAVTRLLVELPRALWRTMAFSLLVQVALILPMTYYFHRVSATSIVSNVAIVTLISLAIPAAFAAVLTGWHGLAGLAAILLSMSQQSAAWFAGYEPTLRIPNPPLWLAASFGMTLTLAAAAWRLRRKWSWAPAAAAAILIAAILVLPFPARRAAGSVEVTAIDVGQGESLLLFPPTGDPLLVDGGGLPAFGRKQAPRLEIGEDVVSPYLWWRGVRRCHAIVVTHLHDDHAGGVPALIANFRPREVLTAFTPDHPAWRKIEYAAHGSGATIRLLTAGDRLFLSGVDIQVLAPGRGRWRGKPHNNDSLVLRLAYGRHTFLLSGDIERSVEARILESSSPGRIDVLKVAHHGSRQASLPAFLESIRPSLALISAGRDNMYGLPSPVTLASLDDLGAMVLRTDRDGLITVRSDGVRLSVERFSQAARFRDLDDFN